MYFIIIIMDNNSTEICNLWISHTIYVGCVLKNIQNNNLYILQIKKKCLKYLIGYVSNGNMVQTINIYIHYCVL